MKPLNTIKKNWHLMIISFGIIVSLGVLFLRQTNQKNDASLVSSSQLVIPTKATDKKSGKVSHGKEQQQLITVDVKGAVKQPAIYTLPKDSRVNDAVVLAGGVTEQGDRNSINLAQKLVDEMVIYVAQVGENISISTSEVKQTETVKVSSSLVNINTADLSDLQKLSGIGLKKAQDIIDYRDQNGMFKKVEDLANVSGFGEKTIEKLRESITVD